MAKLGERELKRLSERAGDVLVAMAAWERELRDLDMLSSAALVSDIYEDAGRLAAAIEVGPPSNQEVTT